MRRHRSGEQWGLARSGSSYISVIETKKDDPPQGAVVVPFGFGPRDELRVDELEAAEARLGRAWGEVVEATKARNEARARVRAERRARN